ncbi:DUF3293 domain-containing protein [Photobacterium sagamiensis]|uniref:DUF3293 domain-containing protein n=1 Tax=Photobacterium sagamiensis TaxID=2910241 RepID=UPI003D1376EF
MCKNASLWRSYQTISFKAGQHPVYYSFAILTAFNPRSIVLNSLDNQKRNKLLKNELAMLTVSYFPVSCCAPDGSWEEEGYIVDIRAEQAYLLAKEWQQNAIYWVEANQLYLVPVLLKGFKKQRLGEFSAFFYT